MASPDESPLVSMDSDPSLESAASVDESSLRHRGVGGARHAAAAVTTTTTIEDVSDSAPTPASPSPIDSASSAPDPSKPNVAHINQGASRSSAHICSNKLSCPSIAAFNALPDEEKDAMPLSENLYACSACRMVLYCCLECQRDDWLATHKQRCPEMRADYEAKHGDKKAAAAAESDASTAAVAASSTSVGAASTASTTPHRNVHINLDVRLGPRTIFVVAMLLYLIYRFYWIKGDAGHTVHDVRTQDT